MLSWQDTSELQLFLIQFDAANGLVRSPHLTDGSHDCEQQQANPDSERDYRFHGASLRVYHYEEVKVAIIRSGAPLPFAIFIGKATI